MTSLEARDLTFSYPGTHMPVVAGWSHLFHHGTLTAITGESGSGKSTRLYLLALMARISGGEILLDGQRVDQLPDAQQSALRAHRFGFIFQDAVLDASRSVMDNILERCLYRGEKPRDWAPAAHALMEELGVSVPPHRKPGQISGGQAQRIALARALLSSPDVIFADEPTGNLDADTASLIMGALKERARNGANVIIVTHDATIASQADETIRITSEVNA